MALVRLLCRVALDLCRGPRIATGPAAGEEEAGRAGRSVLLPQQSPAAPAEGLSRPQPGAVNCKRAAMCPAAARTKVWAFPVQGIQYSAAGTTGREAWRHVVAKIKDRLPVQANGIVWYHEDLLPTHGGDLSVLLSSFVAMQEQWKWQLPPAWGRTRPGIRGQADSYSGRRHEPAPAQNACRPTDADLVSRSVQQCAAVRHAEKQRAERDVASRGSPQDQGFGKRTGR